MKRKYILLIIVALLVMAAVMPFVVPVKDKPLLEYYNTLDLDRSKALYDSFFDQADNAAWVLWTDNGVIHYQSSVYRVSSQTKMIFAEDTYLYVADGYKARLYGEDWVIGAEDKVFLIPAGTQNYINIGKEFDFEISVEEARENVLFFSKKEVEENLDRLLISKNDRAFLKELLSYTK